MEEYVNIASALQERFMFSAEGSSAASKDEALWGLQL